MRAPLTLRAYRGLSVLLEPLQRPFLARRLARGKERADRMQEKCGIPGLARPDGRLIWVHAASVGETVSILPLVNRLVAHGAVLLTTGTVTSAEIAAKRLPAGAFHQFLPLDTAGSVERFLDHWRPDLGMLTESELWPNLMMDAFSRGLPLGIVNGRMSERSHAKWQRLPQTAASLLEPLAFCLAQSDEDARRYAALGAPATSPGNLKCDVPALDYDETARTALRDAIGARPVLVAASTHPGEEEQVIAAAALARQILPDLLTIVVPRHPERGEAVAALCAADDPEVTRRSLSRMPDRASRLHVADTLGELGLFYALADVAFIGGSLVPVGGHNPIEAIKRDAPVITGPAVANFRFVFEELREAQACRFIRDEQGLAEAVVSLVAGAGLEEASRARDVVRRHEGALDRTMAVLLPLLSKARS